MRKVDEGKSPKGKKEVIFNTSMENPDLNDGPFKKGVPRNYFSKWSMVSACLSAICLLWLFVENLGGSAGLEIPSFMAIPGTVLALIVGIGALITILCNLRSYSLLPAFLILLLAISPFVLTWGRRLLAFSLLVLIDTESRMNQCVGELL